MHILSHLTIRNPLREVFFCLFFVLCLLDDVLILDLCDEKEEAYNFRISFYVLSRLLLKTDLKFYL